MVSRLARVGCFLAGMFLATAGLVYGTPIGNTDNKILLVVSNPLYNEQIVKDALDIYRQDILQEGWSSEILLVDSSWTIFTLKESIRSYYQNGYKGLFFIGSDTYIPTPFWEVHPMDYGECPVDLYYADLDDWTDLNNDGAFDSYYTKMENGVPVVENGRYIADETKPANPNNPFFAPELFFSRISPASIMDTYSLSDEVKYIVNYFAKIHKYRMTGGDLSWKLCDRGTYFQTGGGSETKSLLDFYFQNYMSATTAIEARSSNRANYIKYLQLGDQFFRANAHCSGDGVVFEKYNSSTDTISPTDNCEWFDFTVYNSSFPYNIDNWENSISPKIYFYDMGHCSALKYARRVKNSPFDPYTIIANKNIGSLFLLKGKYLLNVAGSSGSGGPEIDVKFYEDLADGIPVGLAFKNCLLRNSWNKSNEPKSEFFGDPLIRYNIPPKGQYLSDLLYRSASNGWSTMKLDKSIDNKALLIRGEQYPKGLGVHSFSAAATPAETVYFLDKRYSRFVSDIGIDDEVNGQGSVIFEVWGSTSTLSSQKQLFSSGTVKGTDEIKKVDVDLAGMNWLVLKVFNNGDGNTCDHADWADARIIKETFLSELVWNSAENGWGQVKSDKSTDDNILSINGTKYFKGLGVHSYSKIVYPISSKYSRFISHIGVDDECGGQGSVTFEVWGSYTDLNSLVKIFDSGTMKGAAPSKKVDLTVTKMQYLVLIVKDNGDGGSCDHAVWGNARLIDNRQLIVENYNCQEKYLSDLPMATVPVNGWGAVKLNKSTDDHAITLNGRQYYKGLGVHSSSEVSYQLGKKYERFISDIGVDDESGNQGSVIFEVWGSTAVLNSQVKLYDSGVMRGNGAARRVNVKVSGLEYITLKVKDNGDGGTSDHADWADARIVTVNNAYTSSYNYISDLNWLSAQTGWGTVNKDLSCDKNILKISNTTYAKGIGTHANSEIVYQIGKQYSRFTAEVGVDAESQGQGSVVFEIWGSYGDQDNKFKMYDSGWLRGTNDAKKVDIDVNNIEYLYLKVTDNGDGGNYDHADWADAKLLRIVWFASDYTPEASWLSDFSWWTTPLNGWGGVKIDKSTDNHTLTIQGQQYYKGLGVHSYSEIVYKLNSKPYSRFTCDVGVDDECSGQGSVVFEVWGSYDDIGSKFKLYDSGTMRGGDAARKVDLNIANMRFLVLIVKDNNDGKTCDHADWCNPQVSRNGCAIAAGYESKPNQTPKITTDLRNKTAISGQLFTLTLVTNDTENNPSIMSISGLPAGATFNGKTLSWTPTTAQANQTYRMILKSVDNYGRIYTEEFAIFVK
ncbi:MAG: NPCBM/NEW2 domain-containing protein [bacterium]|nr:NPCBM/NEW2 domain-containing protein [bacterium]